MGGAAYAEGDGRIERPPEPDLLLKLVAQRQQGARYLAPGNPPATVGDISTVGKPLRLLPDLARGGCIAP